jgi:hypothetical protein
VSARKKAGGAAPKRGPGRPRAVLALSSPSSSNSSSSSASPGLVGEIERIVERKVSQLLKERLGALFR